MQTPKEMIEAIQAFERDGEVQICFSGKWITACTPDWDFPNYKYRPVPKPKEIWVNEYDGECCGIAYSSRERANNAYSSTAIRKAVRYIDADPQ